MSVRELFDGQQAGGFNYYPNRVTKKIFFSKDDCADTAPATIASGQVIKAYTFLESNAAGKLIVHGPIGESATIAFNQALVSTNTVTVGTAGIVFTVGTGGATAAQLASAVATLVSGVGFAAANTALLAAGIATTVGTFTSGTAPAFNFTLHEGVANEVIANSATSATNVADLAIAASAGTAPTLTIVQGSTTFNRPIAVSIYDIDASAADVDAEVYIEASFWADDDGTCALRWATTTGEVLTRADGTTVAVTPYNTGAGGTSKTANLLKRKFVEGTEFSELGFVNVGDRS